ncbi:MAG: zinc dependent phospholipase C family protein [Spirochaetes bacterium]|nr:zinc dependent phospholipase C family protein [Spirochaetota bacterium]
MPGIITHYHVLTESINSLKKDKTKNSFIKSIEVLFNSVTFRKAGLFGAIGPNIFDYLPFQKKNNNGGSNISYKLHSSQSEIFLNSILKTVLSHKDNNNEWSSTQRAYYYGIVSHLIADSVFHPYIYYWSGFSNAHNKKNLFYSREQHLLFEYNMDLFFNETNLTNENEKKCRFHIDNMLPVNKYGKLHHVFPAVKNLLLKAVKDACPEYYRKHNKIKNSKNTNLILSTLIDMIPYFIKISYKIKRSRNPKVLSLLSFLKNKNVLYSDFLINYPPPGKLNTHVLNLHKERWFHPTGISGLHYESVQELLQISCKLITGIWEKTEEILYRKINDTGELAEAFKINSYTGLYNKDIASMNIQDPVRLRF